MNSVFYLLSIVFIFLYLYYHAFENNMQHFSFYFYKIGELVGVNITEVGDIHKEKINTMFH